MRTYNIFALVYLRKVKKHLFCPSEERERLLAEAWEMMDAFLGDYPLAVYPKIVWAFGTPKHFAQELLGEEDVDDCYFRYRNGIYLKVIVTLLVAIVATSGFSVYEYFHGTHVDEVITTSLVEMRENVPANEYYAWKYGINYSCGENGIISEATDNDMNSIAVNVAGIPLDREKYYITEEDKEKIDRERYGIGE